MGCLGERIRVVCVRIKGTWSTTIIVDPGAQIHGYD